MAEKDMIYRPLIHYTPGKNWMNDPNGLIFHNGTYHLFYQYHPYSNEWGPMHWGHAESRDLLHWEEKEVALHPDRKLGMAFSGSAVFDETNSSGLLDDENLLVALYTSNLERERGGGVQEALQQQSLAYSSDNGCTWTNYTGNPIIENPGMLDFRDPTVFFYEKDQSWHMTLSGGDRILFYRSKDLIHWEECGEYYAGSDKGVIECPQLVKVREKHGGYIWCLMVSFLSEESKEAPPMRYFPGDFDGKTFSTDYQDGFPVDFGRDFYAAQKWSGIPEEDRTVWIAWCNNWSYGSRLPTEQWRGVMSIPRELSIDSSHGRPVMKQQPVRELETLRGGRSVFRLGESGTRHIPLESAAACEIILQAEQIAVTNFELEFHYEHDDYWKLGWDSTAARITMERDGLAASSFDDLFMAPVFATIGKTAAVNVRIILDRSLVEIFILDGEYVITSQIFPSSIIKSMHLVKKGREGTIAVEIYELKSGDR